MSEFTPGDYEVISPVTIRREPRILNENAKGVLSIGTKRHVYSVITDEKNQTWGRVSESDAAGQALWICLKSINREYVKRLSVEPAPDRDVMARLAALEEWARGQGYKG